MSIIHSKRKYHYYSKIDQTLPNKCKLTPQSRRKFMKFIWEGNTKKSIYYGGFETGRRGRKVRSKKVNTKAKVVESVTWKTCATTAEGSTNVCFLYKQVTRRRRISRTEKIIVSFSATQNFDFCNQKIVIVSWQTSQNKDLYLQACRNVGVISSTGGFIELVTLQRRKTFLAHLWKWQKHSFMSFIPNHLWIISDT